MRSSLACGAIVMLVVGACGDPAPAIVDAAIVDGPSGDGGAGDAVAIDAVELDGPAVDAAGGDDAMSADAPTADAMSADAPSADAPLADGPTADAMIVDAPADAAPCPIGIDDTVAGVLAITTDDNTRVWLNGVLIDDTPRIWSSPQRYDVVVFAHPAHPNVLAIEGTNRQNASGLDRGIVADLRFTAAGAPQVIVTDAATRATNTLTSGWEAPGFDDSAWPAAVPLGAVGIPPWGAVLEPLAPGSMAQWIWTYDPAPVTDKPVLEATYARRTFAAVDPRCGPVVVAGR